MRYPIKVKAKEDKLGVGATIPKGKQEEKKKKRPRQLLRHELKQVKVKERQQHERLQGQIFGRVDVESYLKGNGNDG